MPWKIHYGYASQLVGVGGGADWVPSGLGVPWNPSQHTKGISPRNENLYQALKIFLVFKSPTFYSNEYLTFKREIKMRNFIVIVVVFLLPLKLNAALWDRGDSLIYDDELNVTWYDYTYQATEGWQAAVDWAENLSIVVNGNPYNNWRLPKTVDGARDLAGGYNKTSSEMGHLYYSSLGNKGQLDINGIYQPGFGLKNKGLFTKLVGWYYWSETEFSGQGDYVWMFGFPDGWQDTRSKDRTSYYAMAVHDGDVGSPVPEPATIILFSSGILLITGINRKRQKYFH